MSEKHSNVQDEDILQMCQDVQMHGNEGYSNTLIERISNSLLSPEWKDKVIQILSGKFRQETENQFLTQNNNTDKRIMKNIARRWISKDSVWNNAMGGLFAIMLFGTNDTSLYSEYEKEIKNVKYWAKFTFSASMGLIFPGATNFTPMLKDVKIDALSGYAKGGELFARGLANFGVIMKPDEFSHQMQIINEFTVQTNNQEDSTSNAHHPKEAELHGQLLHMGLRHAFSGNVELTEAVKAKIYQERATQGEAAGYALGLIQAGQLNVDLVEELVNGARNNPHDRISRPSMFAIALMGLGHQNKVDGIYAKLIEERDPIIRFGAIGMMAMGYVGTSDNEATSKLLDVAATDLSNDVRRLSVIGLALVLIKKPKSALKLLHMLATSYNSSVRHAVALSCGILGANSYDSAYIELIEKLIEDKVDFVRQAAGISLGLVSQLATPHLQPNLEKHRAFLLEKIMKKHETSIAKMGYILGLGLMGAGGGNCCLQLTTESGDVQFQSVIGVFLFVQYWYWFPTFLGIGLALKPTYLIGCTADLKVPTGFTFEVKAPKTHFAYFKTKEEEKEKTKKIGPVVLSMTKRAKVRNKKDKANQIEEEKLLEKIEEEKPEDEKKDAVEKNTHILVNPSRVLKKQVHLVRYLTENNRYEVVLKTRKSGIVFLKDLRPDEVEKFTADQPKESWMIPPADFYFEE